MAGLWEGFSEEDIGVYKEKVGELSDKVILKKKSGIFRESENKNVAREKIPSESCKSNSNNISDIPESAKLFKEKEENVCIKEGKEKDLEHSVLTSNPVCIKILEGKAYELVNKNAADDLSKTTLEVYETRQKMLEEQNKKKKALLAKVISLRKKQTCAEAKRLHHIQEELQKLDLLLSNDVGILRNKIEELSLEYADAQKRYNKAEKEFLEARQNLFGKLEKKELFTKLLCTIIEQNEVRKAQKLSELMEKLKITENGLETDCDDHFLISTKDQLPPLKVTETVQNKENEKTDQSSS